MCPIRLVDAMMPIDELSEAQRIAGIGSWEWVVGNEHVTWSDGLSLILGRDLGLGGPSFATLPQNYTPESWDRVGVAIAAALATGASYELELEMVRANGTTCWTTTRGEAVRGADGDVARLRGTVHDITERKRWEQVLQERAAELREAQRIAGIGSWEWAPGGDIVTWSEGLHLILGRDLSLGAPTFQLLSQSYTPESWARLGAAIATSLETGASYELEVEMVRSDGTICWTATRGEVVRGPDGGVAKLRGTVHDIAERKRSEHALQERAAQLREAQRIAGIGSWEWAPGSDVVTWSEGLYLILGRDLTIAAPTFEALSQSYTPDSFARLGAAIGTAIETGASYELEVEMIRADGTICWTTTRGETVRGPDGRVAKLRGTVHDITARRRADAERESLEDQLRATQKMEAIGSLAGGVAHDFNNLLSVILSYTMFAAESVREGDPLLDDLLEVKNAAERAATLTRQLLAFSRKQVLQPVLLNLNQIADGVERMLKRILGEDIDLVLKLAPDLGLIMADPGQLEQVLMNLVVNARDAMPKGGRLIIETSNVDIDEHYAARFVGMKPGSCVQLVVTDTGCGMSQKTKARLFEPFFTTKEQGKGTGLGLSTVYGIVKQSEGSIVVNSESGLGTTFRIYLPRDVAATVPTAHVPRARSATRPNGYETVLVVEDEAALLKVARRTLESAGYTVLSAANGSEALLAFAQHVGEIHLLLTDVIMPRMGGRDLAEQLVKTQPALKVLYMSGYTDDAIVHHGVLDAGTAFIGKPFTAVELTRKIREVLGATPRKA
jgi:two-component system, cell cycle sensor histidine kinase and response regulator CckA